MAASRGPGRRRGRSIGSVGREVPRVVSVQRAEGLAQSSDVPLARPVEIGDDAGAAVAWGDWVGGGILKHEMLLLLAADSQRVCDPSPP